MKNIWIIFLKMFSSRLVTYTNIVMMGAFAATALFDDHNPGQAILLTGILIIVAILQDKAWAYLRRGALNY